jgi:hypothetical protein
MGRLAGAIQLELSAPAIIRQPMTLTKDNATASLFLCDTQPSPILTYQASSAYPIEPKLLILQQTSIRRANCPATLVLD